MQATAERDTQNQERDTRKRELTSRLDELANQIITDPARLEDFVKAWGLGFHDYSLYNTLMILSQRPAATQCAGFHQWLKLHRFVKKGEKGIGILAPIIVKVKDQDEEDTQAPVRFFKLVYIFDLAQTDGEPLPDQGHSELISGQALELDTLARLFGYPVELEDNTTSNGHTDGKTITLTQRDNKVSMTATYFHELAHCMLHHSNGRSGIPGDIRELEAEATGYLVCAHLGIENERAKYYIGHWASAEKLGNSGAKILKTADQIIRKLEKGK